LSDYFARGEVKNSNIPVSIWIHDLKVLMYCFPGRLTETALASQHIKL